MNRRIDWDRYTGELRGATATDRDLLRSTASGMVLDIGCGIGKHLALIDNPALKVGMDIGFKGLEKGKITYPELALMCGSVFRLPIKSRSFDTAIMIDVVEHLSHPKLALEETHRVLKPGGFLFVQTPNYPVKRLYDVWHRIRGSRGTIADDHTHVSRFNFWSLHSLVSDTGFEIEHATARNILLEKYFPRLRRLKNTMTGKALGQKIIVVAAKAR